MEKDYFPISPTRCRALSCMFYFQQRYLAEKKSEEEQDATASIYLHLGAMVHRVLELYNKKLFEALVAADAGYFEEAFEEAWSENKFIPETEYQEIKEPLLRFTENNPINPDVMLAPEMKIALDWDLNSVEWNADTVFLRGILDRVEVHNGNTAIITDYKNYLPTESSLKKSWQTKIYPFIFFALNNYIEKFILIYHGVRSNEKISFEFTQEEARAIEEPLRNLSKRVARKIQDPETEWIATPSENCAFCFYSCPLAEIGREPIRNDNKLIEIGSKVFVLGQELDRLKNDMKRYMRDTDAKADIGVGIYSMKSIITTNGLKADRIVDICLRSGIDLNTVLSVKGKEIKKLEGNIKEECLAGTKDIITKKFNFTGADKKEEE